MNRRRGWRMVDGWALGYIRVVADFARFFRSPDQARTGSSSRMHRSPVSRPEALRQQRQPEGWCAPILLSQRVLKRPADGDDMPYPKKKFHLPVIWSPEDLASLINAAPPARNTPGGAVGCDTAWRNLDAWPKTWSDLAFSKSRFAAVGPAWAGR